jgi:hypothetical protein
MDSLRNCAQAGGIFYVGHPCGLIVAGIAVLVWRMRK